MDVPPPLAYWPCYCEENIWHLCARPEISGRQAHVAIISNPERSVALWAQRASEAANSPVLWDYHVILLVAADPLWEAWDLDSILGCPLPAHTYLDMTFAGTPYLPSRLAPRFRLVPAAVYRRELRTDRSHMRLENGELRSPEPPWPTIGDGSNLDAFVDMESAFLGEVYDLEGLSRRLGLIGDRVAPNR